MNVVLINSVICPSCHGECQPQASICDRCGAALKNPRNLPKPTAIREQRIIDRPWFILIVLLHVGLLGIPYYLKTNYSLPKRITLCMVSVAYTLFVVAVVAWGLMQILRVFAAF